MNTLTSVVWGPYGPKKKERKINGVVGFDFLYPVMNNMLPEMTNCSSKAVRDIGQQSGTREISCWLFELSGLFLTHSDFLATQEDKEKFGKGGGTDVVGTGEWPIENVFVGKKEPDLADALINAKVLVELTSRTPDSQKTIHYYRVNENLFSEENTVLSGKINIAQSKCLQAPGDGFDVTWFVAHVKESNAYLLVVDGYRRKDSECTSKTQSKPTELRDIAPQTCQTPNLFFGEVHSWQTKSNLCTRCPPGEYSPYPFATCQKCPPGTYSKFYGSALCSNCSIGEYNEVKGQSSCRFCPKGTYSLDTGAATNPCKQCPTGGSCAGGSRLETSILMSTPQPGTQKNLFASYWRDPLVLQNTGKASTCFFQCVEARACLGTLSCSDEGQGIGNTCKQWREIIMTHSPSINGSTITRYPNSKEGEMDDGIGGSYTVSFVNKNLKTQNWNNALGKYQNFSETTSGKEKCSETSSFSETYCVVTRLKEGCAIGYRGETCAGCEIGYARGGKQGTQCLQCEPQGTVIALVTTAAVLGVGFYAFLIYSTLKRYGDLSREVIVARVISSNVLILSLIGELEIQFPDVLQKMMGAGSIVGDPVSMLNLECLLQESTDENDPIPYIILKALITLVLPILFALILGIILGCDSLRAKNTRKKNKPKGTKENDEHSHGDMFTSSLALSMENRFAKNLHKEEQDKKGSDSGETFGGALMSMDSIVDHKMIFKASIVVSYFSLARSRFLSFFDNCFPLIAACIFLWYRCCYICYSPPY